MPGEQVWSMKDDVVEDKRRLDSCKTRETFAATVVLGGRLLEQEGKMGTRRPIIEREKSFGAVGP